MGKYIPSEFLARDDFHFEGQILNPKSPEMCGRPPDLETPARHLR